MLVTDAASFAPRVAPGELATFSDRTWPIPPNRPLDFRCLGVWRARRSTSTKRAVPLLYVSQTQINFQVPSGLAAGTASMYVTRSGGQSALFQFTVVSSAPGIFQDTSNHAIAQNATDSSTNSTSNPVASGAVFGGVSDRARRAGQCGGRWNRHAGFAALHCHCNGHGHHRGDQRNGPVSRIDARIHGLAQANILVPALATADYPLVITVGGYVSASALVSVSGSGTAPPTLPYAGGPVDFCKRQREQRRDLRQHHLPVRTESDQYHRHQQRERTRLCRRVRRCGPG